MSRLAERRGELIDRSAPVTFGWRGEQVTGLAGDTVASALFDSGVKVFSRSFKYHRPRGLLCCAGQCPNCLVQIDGEPAVRACMTPASWRKVWAIPHTFLISRCKARACSSRTCARSCSPS